VSGSNALSPADQSDGELARAVTGGAGDVAVAETELYRRFAPRVRLYGLRHLRDRAAADDLAQQVMLVAIERLRAGQVRDPDQIGSFILGTSRMMAGGLRRTERRREALVERFDLGEPSVAPDDRATDAARLGPCLAAIRDRERTILLLTFYADKSAGEIGAALGMTPVAVRVGRHRALASMRDCLESRRPS
jgi:RNA polymerase sigma-70 factor (ECF subfamily)